MFRRFCGMLAVLAGLAACNPADVMDNSEAKIAEFQADFEAGNTTAIWRTTHPEFRKVVAQKRFETMLGDFRGHVGEMQSSEREKFDISSLNGETSISVDMRTQFENGEGLESFIYREDGDALKLLSYTLQSPALNDYDFSKLEGEGMIYEAAPE